jgi:RNase adapter protein RapZ
MTDDVCSEEPLEEEPLAEQIADEQQPEVVVITGMSGAGRSEAIHTFEDLGYFCVDNLPPSFLPKLVDLAELSGSTVHKLAVVCDVRGHEFFDELAGEIKLLEDRGVDSRVVFLEASDDVLIRRFRETRRRHPMCDSGEALSDGIQAERDELAEIRARADIVIDTSSLRPQELRHMLRNRFFTGPLANTLGVTVSSFGFKYGSPPDADIVMDVRFLPNPYYDHTLRPFTGLDEPVIEYVTGKPETATFLERWFPLLDTVMPGYLAEGKHHLAIGLGCTGGMHRSVVLAEKTAQHLRDQGYRVGVTHRDIGRDRETR